MTSTATNALAARFANRVLRDYPAAQQKLAAHAGAQLAVNVGPAAFRLAIASTGMTEPAASDAEAQTATVSLHIPLAALPRLLARDETAIGAIRFEGDSELASTLSTIARNVTWDVEEDLAQLLLQAGLGKWADVFAHRAVGTVAGVRDGMREAGSRFTENLAEYLVHEKAAFATRDALLELKHDNTILRDDVARLEARINLLTKPTGTTA